MKFSELTFPKTYLPGLKSEHAIISSACREEHGDAKAAEIAIGRAHRELTQLLELWPVGQGATFHVLVTVDRKGRGDPYAP